MKFFQAGRADKPVAEITPTEIQEFITRNGWKPQTRLNNLIDVQTFFSFAVKWKYCADNPAKMVERPRRDEAPPGILTVAQARALMETCQRCEPTLIPTLALCLFAGVRPEEARRLDWDNVRADFVEVPSHKAKTRRRRLVPISLQLRAWLDLGRAVEGQLPAVNYVNKFNRVRRLAEVFDGWPSDAMRHSFASYHLAKHRNENETAQIMGNSPQMIYGHYRELVMPAAADSFFAILPQPETTLGDSPALLSPCSNRLDTPRASGRPRGQRKITAEVLAEVFANGGRKLTKGEAVSILTTPPWNFVASTAYLALEPRGRFADCLSADDQGFLTWRRRKESTAPLPPAKRPLACDAVPARDSRPVTPGQAQQKSEAGREMPLPGSRILILTRP